MLCESSVRRETVKTSCFPWPEKLLTMKGPDSFLVAIKLPPISRCDLILLRRNRIPCRYSCKKCPVRFFLDPLAYLGPPLLGQPFVNQISDDGSLLLRFQWRL